eukprot:TRINITY_DN4576_c0_g1_i2.p1 TRINITY_DN4576_c0_g1~~TRINITY_DN4576_c0_g1_i2.p1  ORF type:complete len:156 (-),score=9.04 TRINITY_DN4576_c0_g1_i2:113-580(-)
MINHRLSHEEVRQVFDTINQASTKNRVRDTAIPIVWFLFYVAFFFKFTSRYMGITEVQVLFAMMFFFQIGFITSIVYLRCVWRKTLQSAVDEVNKSTLHARGLHLNVGTFGQYLSLFLKYVNQPAVIQHSLDVQPQTPFMQQGIAGVPLLYTPPQ